MTYLADDYTTDGQFSPESLEGFFSVVFGTHFTITNLPEWDGWWKVEKKPLTDEAKEVVQTARSLGMCPFEQVEHLFTYAVNTGFMGEGQWELDTGYW